MGSDIDLKELRIRHEALKEERRSWESDWKKLAEHFLPRRCRLEGETAMTNRGGKMRKGKLDSTAFYAMRDLAAGLHGGLTSPARPWFNLTLFDQSHLAFSGAKEWLDSVTKTMRFVYNKSNFYTAISSFYAELATFGTAFMFEVEDERNGVRFIPLTAGEYCIDVDEAGRVDTVFHTIQMTLKQLVQMFGVEKLPEKLRDLHGQARNWNERFQVVHAVYPFGMNSEGAAGASAPSDGGAVVGTAPPPGGGAASAGGAGIKAAPPEGDGFHSVYYLDGNSGAVAGKTGAEPHVLRRAFFHEFPGFGVRWDVTGGDVYGHGPAYDTLPDSVLLQQMTSSLLKALQKEIDPPLAVPPGLENASLLPGAVTPVDPTGAQGKGIYPILQLQHNVRGTYEVILQIQNKVREGLFNNLFRMLLNSDRRQVTAREIAAKEEEKLILIGPVLERLHDEFFIPLSNRTFNILARSGMLPPPPEDLLNMAIVPEFVSILAQAQKLVSTGGVEQFAMFVGNVARMNPEALDAIDYDAMIDDYAEYLGIEADMLRGQDERERIRTGRQRQQQAMQQAQMLQAGIGAMKDLGQADLDGTALGAALEQGQQHPGLA